MHRSEGILNVQLLQMPPVHHYISTHLALEPYQLAANGVNSNDGAPFYQLAKHFGGKPTVASLHVICERGLVSL